MRISDWSSDVCSSDLEVSAVFWFSSTSIKADPFVAGRQGAPGYPMDKLGIENVIESDEEWPTVGWESIAKSDPTVIVIAEVDRRRFPADDVEKKLAVPKTDPDRKSAGSGKSVPVGGELGGRLRITQN